MKDKGLINIISDIFTNNEKSKYEKKLERKLNKYIKMDFVNAAMMDEIYSDTKFSKKEVNEFVKKNFRKIMKYSSDEQRALLIEAMYDHEEISNYISKNLWKTLKYFDLYDVEQTFNFISRKKEAFETVKKYLNENFDRVIEETNDKKNIFPMTIFYKSSDKNNIDEFRDKLEKYINDNPKDYIKYLFYGKNRRENEYNKNYEKVYDLLTMMVQEICEHENVEVKDIKCIGVGGYSTVLGIGTKVLKYGKQRGRFDIPNDKRILNPIIRKDLHTLAPNEEIYGTVEVSDRVDTDIKITKGEMYNLYKELRERGIIYTDIKPENLGRLMKKNDVTQENVADIPEAKGFDKKTESLVKGDLVIFDTDYIYKVGDKNIKWISQYSIDFEKMYKNEIIKNKEEELRNKLHNKETREKEKCK